MNYIFLDIDGVMVPAKSWEVPEILSDGFPAFSSKSVSVINNFIDENSTVILTTSHRANYSIYEWKAMFKLRGLEILNIERLDENMNILSRREELIQWFSTNEYLENFVIIDDDKSLNSLPENLRKHLVQTSSTVGLTEVHIEEILLVLS